MLQLREVRVAHGAATAIWGVSLHVAPGELVCVVGPNGAGKTTLIEAIAGLNRIAAGTITIEDEDLSRLPSHRFCDRGIAIVPEGRRLFTGLSVRENLELGSYRKAARATRASSLEQVLAVFPALKVKLEAPAGTLSGGQQQMVAIGRALMCRPKLLLLDEQHRGAGRVHFADRAKHHLHHQRREAERRLVEEQQPRLRHQRTADRDHLLLPAR